MVSTLGKLLGVPPYDPGSPDQIANPTGTWPRGQVIETSIPGPASGVGSHFAMVYLPPQYYTEPDATFPVVYALHGTPGFRDPRGEDAGPYDIFVNSEVDNAAQAAAKAGHPVVIIAPVVSPMSLDTECVDGPLGKWATYLTKDVPAWAAQYPRLRTAGDDTAIGGFSMGGTCAQVTALRNPQQYSVSGNLSGSPKASNEAGDAALFGTGPQAAKPSEYDSTAIIAANPQARTVKLWLGVGNADNEPGLVADMTTFADVARGYGMTVELVLYPGGHSFDVWRPAFGDWIPWAASALYGETPRTSSSPSPSSSSPSSSSSSP
jgi:S-formylglutathione hydrolase FrmB